MNVLAGKVAVITGGSRGLGYAIAKAYAQEGAQIVIGSRSQDSVEKAVESLKSLGYQANGIPCDVTIRDQVQALGDHALMMYGQLDVWINNAGLSCPVGPTVHIPPEYFDALLDTNIRGVYYGSLVAMHHFLKQRHGKLINILGRGYKSSTPMFNPYGSSKAWVRFFTLGLAKEYRNSGVGVYLFHPGLVKSDMMGHLTFVEGYYEQTIKVFQVIAPMFAIKPEIPANKAVWLASDATDGKTGLTISLLTMSTMLKGAAREGWRVIMRRPAVPIIYDVSFVKPAIDLPVQPESSTHFSKKKATIVSLNNRGLHEFIGNKAKNLHWLKRKNFLVPDTWVCPWDTYDEFLLHPEEVLKQLKSALERIILPGQTYAVRSSANIEDSLEHSFAGQFSTLLNVEGIDSVINAIQDIWLDTQKVTVRSYIKKIMGENCTLKMAVIIQKMIPPVVSGVAFSKNPITTLDEVIIEAVEGFGTSLVQEGRTPHRWVNKWGGWVTRPDFDPIPLEVIQKIVEQTKKISRKFKKDVDLEWVYDGKNIYWVQLRDITSIDQATIYSNRMAKEMTPGLVKPLAWSVTIPNPSKVWVKLIQEITGKNSMDPKRLMRAFHYHAYQNMGEFSKVFNSLGLPRETLEMMLGILPPGAGKMPMKPTMRMLTITPRAIRFLYDKWNFSRRLDTDYPRLFHATHQYTFKPGKNCTEQGLIQFIDQIQEINGQLVYDTIVSILLMQIYNIVVRNRLRKLGVEFQQFDLTGDLDELKAYDPAYKLENLHQFYRSLTPEIQAVVQAGDSVTLNQMAGAIEFNEKVTDFIDEFGHLSDTTGHFGNPSWRETPGLILKLIASYEKPAEASGVRIQYADLPKKDRILKIFYPRTRQFRLYREKFSSLYTYSLMLFRAQYLAIGERWVDRDLLDTPEDILYLYDEEVRAYINGAMDGSDFHQKVKQRHQEMDACKDAVLPGVIFGEEAPLILPSRFEKLTGTPTSKGYYTGPIRVVQGVEDFESLQSGDVLVIPFSDVSWTPLFAHAGAVIAESGGILSHSSIIAREYNIPAVVSVSGALQLKNNTVVTVDGYKGEILIMDSMAFYPSSVHSQVLEENGNAFSETKE